MRILETLLASVRVVEGLVNIYICERKIHHASRLDIAGQDGMGWGDNTRNQI